MDIVAFVAADGTVVAVLHPNPDERRVDEDEVAFLARLADGAVAGSPELASLTRVILPRAALPAERVRTTASGEHLDVRGAWVYRDGQIVIEEARIRPLRRPETQ